VAGNGQIAPPTEAKPSERRPWGLATCGCGCCEVKPWHRMRLVKDAENHAYFVTAACEEPFKVEIANLDKLKFISRSLKGTPCWRRWKFAKMVWLLTYCIYARLSGEDVARAFARRRTVLFCSPAWLVKIIGPRWKV